MLIFSLTSSVRQSQSYSEAWHTQLSSCQGKSNAKTIPGRKMPKDVNMAERVKASRECSSFSPFCRAVNLQCHRLCCYSWWPYQASLLFLPCLLFCLTSAHIYLVFIHQPEAVFRHVQRLVLTVCHTLIAHIKHEWLTNSSCTVMAHYFKVVVVNIIN